MNNSFIDNSAEIKKELEESKMMALIAIGMTAEKKAKEGTPVVTGRLKNSMTFATKGHDGITIDYKYKRDGEKMGIKTRVKSDDEDAVYIGTNVEYAQKVELGGPHNKARHMMYNAIVNNTEIFRHLIIDAFRSGKLSGDYNMDVEI